MTASPEQIKFCAQWLLTHAQHWSEGRALVSQVAAEAASVSIDPAAWNWVGLARFKDKYDQFAGDVIPDAAREGTQCTAETGTLLIETARNYINIEAENEAIAGQISKELDL